MAHDVDPTQSPTTQADTVAEDPLPTMADLDRVASELDAIDARLAALDEQRP